MSAVGALGLAVALAGCGKTYYFAGRTLPPSGLINRVMIAIQNPSSISRGSLEIVDGYYDIRYQYNDINKTFSVSGFSGALPTTIQNMPEEQLGAVYNSGDGSYVTINYAKESANGALKGLNGTSSSVFITRNQQYLFAASQTSNVVTIVDNTSGKSYALNLPGVYRLSVNPGGTAAMFFAQNSNFLYYALKLSTPQTLSYSGGPSTWPLGAVDCEPQNAPGWCLFQALDPASTRTTPVPLTFDRPVKAVFSNDGGTAYVLNCGPECGGGTASISLIPVGPMIFQPNQQSGTLPSNTALHASCASATGLSSCTLPIPGGSSNALINSSIMYVLGQQKQSDGLFAGNLTVLDLSGMSGATLKATSSTAVSDGAPGAPTRMILADDNTLWLGTTQCNNGERAAKGLAIGCLTMYNTSSNSVTMIEPFKGDATGVAAVTNLHKVYAAEGGQVYVYSTRDGSALNNQYVTVNGTAYDVAYMDGLSDANNTVY